MTDNKKEVRAAKKMTQSWVHCLDLRLITVLLVLPPLLNYAAIQKEQRELQSPGKLFNIGFGQNIYMSCEGSGLPVVLLDAPTGLSSDAWVLVQKELSQITQTCVFDRAGLGFSDRPVNTSKPQQFIGRPFTTERMVDDLHRLVTFINPLPKPFILVGAELGAVNARFYTQIYESDVLDLVLIDPLVETVFSEDNSVWNHFWYDQLVPSLQALHIAAAVGLTRLFVIFGLLEPQVTGPDLPEIIVNRQKHLLCYPRHLSSVVDEHHFINESIAQLRMAWIIKSFPANVSVTVLTGNYHDETLPSHLNMAWAKSQQHLVSSLHPGSRQLVINGADRHMLYRHPSAVTEPIKRLIHRKRRAN